MYLYYKASQGLKQETMNESILGPGVRFCPLAVQNNCMTAKGGNEIKVDHGTYFYGKSKDGKLEQILSIQYNPW